MSLDPTLAWVVALGCEAHPLHSEFGLRPLNDGGPFPLYHSACGRHSLVRSGVGRTNAAAATAYLFQHLGGSRHIAWLNVGVAGHGTLPLGTTRLIHQIHEATTGKVFYPTQVFAPPFPGAVLTTVDIPQTEMSDDSFYDMEGAGFFDLASRFSSQELVGLVKCVSDHGSDGEEWPKKEVVSDWIGAQLPGIRAMAEGLLDLSAAEGQRRAEPPLGEILEVIHFTVAQQHQLRGFMRRWNVLRPSTSIWSIAERSDTAREFLSKVGRELDSIPMDWMES